MTVYITKVNHFGFRYLLNWHNPDTGAMMGTWFRTKKDLDEYIAGWNAAIVDGNAAGLFKKRG